MMRYLFPLAAIFASAGVAAQTQPNQQQPNSRPQAAAQTVNSTAGPLQVEVLANGLEFPWGLAFLPDGRLLITEKPGRIKIFDKGGVHASIEVPGVHYRAGKEDQGGLLDIAIDPAFAQNGYIYLAFVETDGKTGRIDPEPRFGGAVKKDETDNQYRGGAVARARFDGKQLQDVRVIWRQVPKTIGRGHFGHRIVFAPDGMLFITSGERMRFDPAQDMSSNLGKVVRIAPDGSIPKDNPFTSDSKARGDIWTLGHRNMLAAAIDPASNDFWVWEMGPKDGDEMNLIVKGRNYGWPIVSDGDNYDGSRIPDHRERAKFEAPVRSWTPVISPSGAMFYKGALLPWKNDAIIGTLSGKALVRFTLNASAVVNEERIDMGKRIRALAEAPDGSIHVLTDGKSGELLRISPANKP